MVSPVNLGAGDYRALRKQFRDLDTNGDRKIDETESKELSRQWDTDGNGSAELWEFLGQAASTQAAEFHGAPATVVAQAHQRAARLLDDPAITAQYFSDDQSADNRYEILVLASLRADSDDTVLQTLDTLQQKGYLKPDQASDLATLAVGLQAKAAQDISGYLRPEALQFTLAAMAAAGPAYLASLLQLSDLPHIVARDMFARQEGPAYFENLLDPKAAAAALSAPALAALILDCQGLPNDLPKVLAQLKLLYPGQDVNQTVIDHAADFNHCLDHLDAVGQLLAKLGPDAVIALLSDRYTPDNWPESYLVLDSNRLNSLEIDSARLLEIMTINVGGQPLSVSLLGSILTSPNQEVLQFKLDVLSKGLLPPDAKILDQAGAQFFIIKMVVFDKQKIYDYVVAANRMDQDPAQRARAIGWMKSIDTSGFVRYGLLAGLDYQGIQQIYDEVSDWLVASNVLGHPPDDIDTINTNKEIVRMTANGWSKQDARACFEYVGAHLAPGVDVGSVVASMAPWSHTTWTHLSDIMQGLLPTQFNGKYYLSAKEIQQLKSLPLKMQINDHREDQSSGSELEIKSVSADDLALVQNSFPHIYERFLTRAHSFWYEVGKGAVDDASGYIDLFTSVLHTVSGQTDGRGMVSVLNASVAAHLSLAQTETLLRMQVYGRYPLQIDQGKPHWQSDLGLVADQLSAIASHYHISDPTWFPMNVLAELAKNLTDPGNRKGQAVTLAIYPKSDWNTAFHGTPEYWDSLLDTGQRFELYQADRDTQLPTIIRETANADGPIQTFVLGGHGERYAMNLSTETGAAGIIDVGDHFRGLKDCFAARAQMLLMSCSTNKIGGLFGHQNLNRHISRELGIDESFAPDRPNGVAQILFDDKHRIVKVVGGSGDYPELRMPPLTGSALFGFGQASSG